MHLGESSLSSGLPPLGGYHAVMVYGDNACKIDTCTWAIIAGDIRLRILGQFQTRAKSIQYLPHRVQNCNKGNVLDKCGNEYQYGSKGMPPLMFQQQAVSPCHIGMTET